MDAAGKDGTIKHVMSGVNPQGVQVYSFKAPSPEELDHDYLWRCMRNLPERGRIGIFNRSYYEEVLVARVHPEILERQKLPPQLVTKRIWEERYEDIRNFERYLARNGVVIRKFFLHVSKGEQKRRFLARLDEPEKNWKFSANDVAERRHWKDYQRAYEDAIRATATDAGALVRGARRPQVVHAAGRRGGDRGRARRPRPALPEGDAPEQRRALAAARRELLAAERGGARRTRSRSRCASPRRSASAC